uniref:phospholipase A2 n=1 Tax=Lepisosteus oculatus TaxID=7918 RepID=W5MF14_LEPOC
MFNGTFCAKSARVGAHDLHQVPDGVEEVRSVRDPRGGLLDCAVVSSPMEVKSFMHVCRLGLRDRRRASPAPQGQTAGAERGESQDVGGARTAPRRTKRGFTYPGTLWCGAGNNAEHYDHLGEFADTDSCCREHDHCPYVIQPFSSRYGYRNFRWHTICHCDCDNALKACLRKVNDTSSRVVGQAFFNVIQVPCFEFRYEEQCVERLWYGWCQRYEKVPIAVAQESVTYDFGGIEVIDELTIAPPARKDEEEEGARAPATATQAPPALGHMVTAAEDFIKVLATVSTSQSTVAESAKEEREQGAEQKKNKKTSRKK